MASHKIKKHFIKINSNGEGILIQGKPNKVRGIAGQVYEVPGWLKRNIIHRDGGEEVKESEALKLIKAPADNAPTELEDFTVPQLKEICDQEGVEVESAWNKPDIIKALRALKEDDED